MRGDNKLVNIKSLNGKIERARLVDAQVKVDSGAYTFTSREEGKAYRKAEEEKARKAESRKKSKAEKKARKVSKEEQVD